VGLAISLYSKFLLSQLPASADWHAKAEYEFSCPEAGLKCSFFIGQKVPLRRRRGTFLRFFSRAWFSRFGV
jgi:hypothetical protein